MKANSCQSVVQIRPGCSARPAAARFRRAFAWPILTRPPIRAIQPWGLLQISVKTSWRGKNIGLPDGKESLTKSQKSFHLNYVPKQRK
jgi:hypothetical protein